MSTLPKNTLNKRRILFAGEAVAISHVSRPLVLAQTLNPDQYDIHFASDSRSNWMFKNNSFQAHPLPCIDPDRSLKLWSDGHTPYNKTIISGYVDNEIAIIKDVAPDLIVADYRLSLSISSKVCNVPYAAIISTQWSSYATVKLPTTDNKLLNWMNDSVAAFVLNLVIPIPFFLYSLPFDSVRKQYGLPLLHDWRKNHNDADFILYPDIPDYIPTKPLPPEHHFLGPTLWSPDIPLPPWWDELPKDKPIVYLSLGSTGRIDLLPEILNGLKDFPITVVAATANRPNLEQNIKNVFMAPYLPGDACLEKAAIAITNGGTTANHQALSKGVPILGITRLLDQDMSMRSAALSGVGIHIRSSQVNRKRINESVETLFKNLSFTQAAQQMKKRLAAYKAFHLFNLFVDNFYKGQAPR
jgi:UDP:flavonoid glycosyltransferase YjiC (YdhE family)